MFPIAKKVKVPPVACKGKWVFLYSLKVGDSFVCSLREARSALTLLKYRGMRGTSRCLEKGKATSDKAKCRVWRVK